MWPGLVQEPDWFGSGVEITDKPVPRLLGHPCRIRMRGHSGEVELSGRDLDEEKDVKSLHPYRLHREEVISQNASAWALKNSAQVGPVRLGAGSMPLARRSLRTVVAPTIDPELPQLTLDP